MNLRYLPWAIAALYLLFLFPSPEFPPYNADDGSWFVNMGWNLAEYGRYTSDTYPLTQYGHHGAWPPLFSGVLGGVISLAGLDWVALKLVMVLFGLAALALLLRLWRDDTPGKWAVLLTALSPAFFLFSHHTMSEVPYIAAVAAALLALSRAETGRMAFLAGLVAVLAFFTRGYAVIFLPAGLLYFLLRPWPWRQRLIAGLAFTLPLLVAVLAWKGYTGHVLASQPLDWITARFGNGTGILNDLLRSPVEYAQRLYWHDLRYPVHFLLPFISLEWARGHDLSVAISLVLLGLVGYGWLTLFRRRQGAVECWLPLALALLLVPRTGAARYWLPFLPFLYYYLLHGVQELAGHLPRGAKPLHAVPFMLLAAAGGMLAWHLAEPDRLRFISPQSKIYRDVAVLARERLPGNAVVIAPFRQRFTASSGLASWPADQIQNMPDAIRVSGRPIYLFCTPDTTAALCSGREAPVLSLENHAIYRYQP
jgi:4-amino-4-deoxy-L-arabinose transferase-like glycosyltransferase